MVHSFSRFLSHPLTNKASNKRISVDASDWRVPSPREDLAKIRELLDVVRASISCNADNVATVAVSHLHARHAHLPKADPSASPAAKLV
jgi:hypothetical protein